MTTYQIYFGDTVGVPNLIKLTKQNSPFNFCKPLAECNFRLGCTLLSRNKITPELLCIFIVISIISREITLGQVHSVLLHVCLTWEKQVASSKTWHCMSLWGVYARR